MDGQEAVTLDLPEVMRLAGACSVISDFPERGATRRDESWPENLC